VQLATTLYNKMRGIKSVIA